MLCIIFLSFYVNSQILLIMLLPVLSNFLRHLSHVSTNSPGKMYNIYTLLMSLKHLYPLKYARTQLPTKLAVVTFLASEVRPSYEPQNGLSLQ